MSGSDTDFSQELKTLETDNFAETLSELSEEDFNVESEEVKEIRESLSNSTVRDTVCEVNYRRKRSETSHNETVESLTNKQPSPKRSNLNKSVESGVIKTSTPHSKRTAGEMEGGFDWSEIQDEKSETRKKWMLVAINHPTTNLSSNDFLDLQDHISNLRTSDVEMEKILLAGMMFENGSMIIWTKDDYTEKWLKAINFDLPSLPKVKLLDPPPSDLVRCTIKIIKRKTKYMESEFIRQLEAGNKGLTVKKLELITKTSMPDGIYQLVVFKVDPGAIEYFDKVNGRIHFDTGMTFVNYRRKSNPPKRSKLDGV